MSLKDTNPKEAVGTAKPPLSTVSGPVLAELGVAMAEGARKYGRHNYRVSGVRASTYYDAMFRHMVKWFEGEDIDADSGLSHITKAIATLFVLRDAMIQGMLNDDRPPKSPAGFFLELEKACKAVIAKYPDAKDAFTEIGQKIGQVPDSEIVLQEAPVQKARATCVLCQTRYNIGERHGCASQVNALPRCSKCELSTEPMIYCYTCNRCDDCCKCI